MPLIEIEVKFYIENYEEIIKKITNYAGKPVKEGFERNILFDTNNFDLRENSKVLRLRSYMGKNIVTLKKAPKNKNKEFKILEEVETEFNSFDEMRLIFNSLGYNSEQIYEKERQVYEKSNLLICVDRLPFGDFIELEGGKNEIISASDYLNLNWEERILPSYRTIFEKIKENQKLSFNQITFKNFKDLKIENFKKILKSL